MVDGECLCDTASESVTYDTTAIDSQLVEKLDDPVCMCACADLARERTVASAKSEEVEDNQAVSGRHERDNVTPEVARRRKSVNEHNGYAGPARSSGVVVETRAGKVEKLTAHAREGSASAKNNGRMVSDSLVVHKRRECRNRTTAFTLIRL